MTRISYRRATPENWERTIKRMVSLNHVTLSPEDARAILRYLADHQGLAPEELRPIAFEAERRMIDYTYKADETTANLEELHKGVSKAYPCGAGLGLLGVATDGDVALCHRFAGSDAHKLGTVRDGIDRNAQHAFYATHHVDNKTDCSVCWARPLCSGGCYHEAHTRYGDTTHANLHYCEWIRGWTDVCLRVYGELSVRNPAYLAQFDDEGMRERVS